MMKKILHTVIGFAVVPQAIFAQSLNPTVEVTRTYEGKVVEVHKAGTEVVVPDTLTKFNYNVDYSVFESPYKGSYEFRPYVIEMRPEASKYEGNTFFLDAGCMYPLEPHGNIVYSPKFRNSSLGLSFYGNFESYDGHMRGLKDETYAHKNLDADGGVCFSYESEKLRLNTGVAYSKLSSEDEFSNLDFGTTSIELGVSSPFGTRKGFDYDFKISADLGADAAMKENVIDIDGLIGIPVGRLDKGKLCLGIGGSLVFGDILQYESGSIFYFSPKYSISGNRGDFSIGAKVSNLLLSPELDAEFFLVPQYLKVYAKLSGGQTLNTYSFLRDTDPFLRWDNLPDLGASKNILDSKAGIRGTVGSSFSYDINAGWTKRGNSLFISSVPDENSSRVKFCDYSLFTAGGTIGWTYDNLSLSFHGTYSSTDIDDNEVFTLPSFTGGLNCEYNWNKRIFLRVGLEYQGERETVADVCPAWADLSLAAEYRVNSFLTVYLEGENLLNQNVQRVLYRAYDGVDFGGGISLKFGKNK